MSNIDDAIDGVTIDGKLVQRDPTIQLHMPEKPTTGLWCSPFAEGPAPQRTWTGGEYTVTSD